jgi:hypothetical protein
MYYKCNCCGHFFEEGEQKKILERHGLDYPPYEESSVCPVCNGDYEEMYKCESCGEFTLYEYNGYCGKCITEMIDYENALDYLIEKKALSFFVFDVIFNVDEPQKMTPELMEELKMIYKRKKIEDLMIQKPVFLGNVKEFISDDIFDFAEFLKDRGEI